MATAGVCLYCGVTDEQVDGNKLSWHDASRVCCSKYACVTRHHAARLRRGQKPKPTSRFAEIAREHPAWGRGAISEQIRREEAAQRRRARRKRAA